MSIERNGREFLGIWRGSREFTELHRGGRVLWRKNTSSGGGDSPGGEPEVPKRRIAKLKLTATNTADFAVIEFTSFYIRRGLKGSVRANIGGEAHSLSGAAAPLKTSTMSISKCQSATVTLDASTSLTEGDVAVGGTITITAALPKSNDLSAIQRTEATGLVYAPFWCPIVDSRVLIEIQFWGCANSSQTLTGKATVTLGTYSSDIKSRMSVSKSVSLTRNKTVKAFAVNFTRAQINTFCASGLNTGTPYVRAYLNPVELVQAFKTATSGSISMEWGWNAYSLNLSFTVTEIEYAD